tara:strand:- start:489 stop:749 length:261 start_codon:yes stop_codon:yes gene_type:complete
MSLVHKKNDNVKSPKHYEILGDFESITIIASTMTEDQWFGFCLGNIIKYRLRAGKKNDVLEDIAKSDFYKELYTKHKKLCRGKNNG